MKVLSELQDRRIHSTNLLAECTFQEYLSFAKHIKDNNEFQRKRVKTSKTIYSLLKEDLEQGCIIPPIVLAISQKDIKEFNSENLLEYILENQDNVMILDGLQRTYTLLDADAEMGKKTFEDYEAFKNNKLRLEVYVDINKFGILYRMLTLNTGQTPMQLRHQLEMLYSDMIDTSIQGIKLVKDTEGKADADSNEFVFKNAIEGFNSYLSRSELPIDREELLDNIRIMEKMSDESANIDMFIEYLDTYAMVFNSLREISNNHEITDEELSEYGINGNPFGKKVSKVFSSSQSMTGFGAAMGKMKDLKVINNLEEIKIKADSLKNKYNGEEAYEWLLKLLYRLDTIRNSSKKIGNAQRMYFHYFFRELFNSESDSYLDLDAAAENGYHKYLSQVG